MILALNVSGTRTRAVSLYIYKYYNLTRNLQKHLIGEWPPIDSVKQCFLKVQYI